MICSQDGCCNVVIARKLCNIHYKKWRKYGDPQHSARPPRNLTVEQHLYWHGWTVTESGCWEWNGPTNRREKGRNYGCLQRRGVSSPVHRLAYELWVGPIPEGLLIRHKCDNPPCMNPDHLETGTAADNARDRESRFRRPRMAGEAHPNAKLSIDDVYEIRWLLGLGAKNSDLRKVYSVGRTAIDNIKTGKKWRTV